MHNSLLDPRRISKDADVLVLKKEIDDTREHLDGHQAQLAAFPTTRRGLRPRIGSISWNKSITISGS